MNTVGLPAYTETGYEMQIKGNEVSKEVKKKAPVKKAAVEPKKTPAPSGYQAAPQRSVGTVGYAGEAPSSATIQYQRYLNQINDDVSLFTKSLEEVHSPMLANTHANYKKENIPGGEQYSALLDFKKFVFRSVKKGGPGIQEWAGKDPAKAIEAFARAGFSKEAEIVANFYQYADQDHQARIAARQTAAEPRQEVKVASSTPRKRAPRTQEPVANLYDSGNAPLDFQGDILSVEVKV